MRIIFDLDGTLVCCKKRIYDLFFDLVSEVNIDYDDFWGLKLKGYNNEWILRNIFGYSDEEYVLFFSEWMRKIESSYYIDKDILFEGVFGLLNRLHLSGNSLYLCTARQSKESAVAQLKKFGIYDFFEEIFVTFQRDEKYKILNASNIRWCENDWIVGDNGKDIEAGHVLGVKACAVLTGVMSKENLTKYKPNLILNKVLDFEKFHKDAS